MLLALIAAQAASPAAAPPPERFSVLAPVAPQPCPPRAEPRDGDDVVVCATDLPDQTVPYPEEYVGNRPRASNPGLTGTGALGAESTPCAASQWGCTVGFGPPIMPIVKGLVGLVKDATAKKPDKRGRVPIDISEPATKRQAPDAPGG